MNFIIARLKEPSTHIAIWALVAPAVASLLSGQYDLHNIGALLGGIIGAIIPEGSKA